MSTEIEDLQVQIEALQLSNTVLASANQEMSLSNSRLFRTNEKLKEQLAHHPDTVLIDKLERTLTTENPSVAIYGRGAVAAELVQIDDNMMRKLANGVDLRAAIADIKAMAEPIETITKEVDHAN